MRSLSDLFQHALSTGATPSLGSTPLCVSDVWGGNCVRGGEGCVIIGEEGMCG